MPGLDARGVPPRALRWTRLADLVNTIGPGLVAAAFGIKPESVMFYLANHVDPARMPPRRSRFRALEGSLDGGGRQLA